MSYLKGEVEIIKREAEWDEEKQEWVPKEVVEVTKKQNNIGTLWFHNRTYNSAAYGTSVGVVVSPVRTRSRNYTAGAGNGDTIGTPVAGFTQGEWTSRVPFDIYEPATTLAHRTWRYRFDPPGSTRYIGNISLKTSASDLDPVAGVGLTELCIQTTSQILDIFYRIYVDDETTDTAIMPGAASKRHIIEQGYGMFDSTSTVWFPLQLVLDWWPSSVVPHSTQEFWSAGNFNSPSDDGDVVAGVRNLSWNLGTTDGIGRQFSSASYARLGNNATCYRASHQPLLPAGASRVQSTFGKAKTSVNPYLDIDNGATGTGSVLVTEDVPGTSWAPAEHKFAEAYRIFITTSGDVIDSEYKFYKRVLASTFEDTWSTNWEAPAPRCPSWFDSTYMSRADSGGSSSNDDGLRHGAHGFDGDTAIYSAMMNEDAPYYQTYNWPEYLSVGIGHGDTYDPANNGIDGITIYDLNGFSINLNANTTPALGVSDIRQVVSESDGTIWVACSDTGLWKITRAGGTDLSDGLGTINTIALIVPTPGTGLGQVLNSTICRGVVAEKTSGVAAPGATLWAIFDKEMCKSVDSGVTWTVYNDDTDAGVTVKDGQFVIAGVTDVGDVATGIMHFEKDHHHATKERFFIAIRDNVATSDGRGAWWSTDLTDNPGGAGVKFMADSSDFPTHKIVGTKCIYGGSDGDWYFAIDNSVTGISRFAYNATSQSGENTSTSISTRVGQGINVWYDVNGDDYIVGFDHDNSDVEMVKGRRPVDVLNTAGPYKVLSYRIGNNTGTVYDSYLSHLCAYIGQGLWLSNYTSSTQHYMRYYQFCKAQDGGVDNTGVVTDPELWVEYGWAGGIGPWTAGDSTPKPTHASAESLVDGVSVAFVTDGGAATSFDTADMYDSFLFDGVLKDNATTVDYDFLASSVPLVSGTEFVDSTGTSTDTIPGSPVGSVTNEISHTCQVYSVNTEEGYTDPGEYTRMHFSSSDQHSYGKGEQVLSGDFTVEFKASLDWKSTTWSGHYSSFGLLEESDNSAGTGTFDGGYFFVNGRPANNGGYIPSDNTRKLCVGEGVGTNGAFLGSVDHVFQKTDPMLDNYWTKDNLDLFRIQRISGEIRYAYKRNGEGSWTDIYGQGGEIINTNDVVLNEHHYSNDGQTFYNINATYNDPRHFVFIGDGTTTGPGNNQDANGVTDNFPDPNFKGTAIEFTGQMVIEVEDTPASNVYTSRTVIGSNTIYGQIPGTQPAVGEVLMLKSGKVVFNAADAGKKFRGNWVYYQTLNLK